jgi:DNA (cytosine-5)-methyltransferase 1
MRPLTYATVCSGIECMSAAVSGLPFRPVFFSEIEPYPCAILRYRYPNVPNLGDMTQIEIDKEKGIITNGTTTVAIPDGGLDILAGGTPCQDFSVAGLRKGADGDNCDDGGTTRSSLCFNFIRLLRGLQPRFFIYENVYGMLTSNSGRDFAHFLVALGQSGYVDVSWRVLDAQYVRVDGLERAVPQRRRRVWVVGCLGSAGQRSAQILLEPGRMCGDSAPIRKTKEEVFAAAGGRAQVHDQVVAGAGVGCSGVTFDEFHQFPVAGDNTSFNLVNGTSAGHHNGVIHKRVSGVDFYNNCMTGNVSKTLNCAATDKDHTGGVLLERKDASTNSNGDDVMPSICANESKLGGDNQHIHGGGVRLHPSAGTSICSTRT